MPEIIKKYDNKNKPILDVNNSLLPLTYFNLLHLKKGETYQQKVDGFETVLVVLSGDVDIEVDGEKYANVRRKNIWEEKADAVYAPTGAEVRVYCNRDNTEVAVGGGRCNQRFASFRVSPEEVGMVEVGSSETKTHRKIFHIIGSNAEGKTGNIIINELTAEEGCWSGYPPHKHDTEQPPVETAFEELYHFRFNPENGFGAQFVFQPNDESVCYMTKSGDTVCIDKGYHPTVYSPGHQGYMFVILMGKEQRALIQNFREEYAYLANGIPGVSDMLANYQKCK